MKFHEFISLMSMAALAKSIIVRRSLHGVLLSTETTGEITFNSYDAFARVAQTWRAAVSAATGTTGVSPVGGSGALAASVLHLLPHRRPPRHAHLHQLLRHPHRNLRLRHARQPHCHDRRPRQHDLPLLRPAWQPHRRMGCDIPRALHIRCARPPHVAFDHP